MVRWFLELDALWFLKRFRGLFLNYWLLVQLFFHLCNVLQNFISGKSMFVNLFKKILVVEVELPVSFEIVHVFVEGRDLQLRCNWVVQDILKREFCGLRQTYIF